MADLVDTFNHKSRSPLTNFFGFMLVARLHNLMGEASPGFKIAVLFLGEEVPT